MIRRTFTEEFKCDAVALIERRGSVHAAARELGIAHSVLFRWKERLAENPDRPFPGHGNPLDLELAKVRRENVRLKEDNEILKKAVGIFSIRPK